ncbi:hypothetical protein HZR84_09890 [Hyphobacterium sp. CCMP332]|nr:hypothetical protein HZR84_09890 [Hyphobacterium sp. CCMP332]
MSIEPEHIDQVLNEIESKGFFAASQSTPDHLHKALKRLERENMVYEKNNYSYDLTSLGQEVIDLGGYVNWKNKLQEGEETESKIKELTIKQLKGNIFQLKYWWVILILSSVLGFISGNFQLIIKWITGE